MRYLYFNGAINRRRVEWVIQKMREEGGKHTVIVNSPGGTFEFFSVLGPPISRRAVTTVGLQVESAAVALFLLGDRRVALPESTFFFHDVRVIVGPYGEITLTDVENAEAFAQELRDRDKEVYEAWAHSMRSAQSWLSRFMSERTGLPMGLFLELMHREVRLNAFEARSHGIVHTIVPTLQQI